MDEANGGIVQVRWFSAQGRKRALSNDSALNALLQHARAEYERAGGDPAYEAKRKKRGQWFEGCGLAKRTDHEMIEHWVNEEFGRVVTMRTLKRWSKTKTIFRLKTDQDGEFRTMSTPYAAEVAQFLTGKYGDSLDFVFNPARPALQGIS